MFVPIGKQRKKLPMVVVRAPVRSAPKVICGMMVPATLAWKEPTRRMRIWGAVWATRQRSVAHTAPLVRTPRETSALSHPTGRVRG